jgi:hypothetical protein
VFLHVLLGHSWKVIDSERTTSAAVDHDPWQPACIFLLRIVGGVHYLRGDNQVQDLRENGPMK